MFSFFGAGREGDWPPPALLARFAHVDLVIWFLTLFRSATCTYMYVVYEKASTDVLQRDDEKINFRRTFVNINCEVRTPRTQHVYVKYGNLPSKMLEILVYWLNTWINWRNVSKKWVKPFEIIFKEFMWL